MLIHKNAQLLIVERFAIGSLPPVVSPPGCSTLATNKLAKISTPVLVSSSIRQRSAFPGIYVAKKELTNAK